MQHWAKFLLDSYWNKKSDRRVIEANTSIFMRDIVGELSNLSEDYNRVNSNKVPFLFHPINHFFSNTSFYNGHSPSPSNNSHIDSEKRGQIKLKNLRLTNGRCKSKDRSEELLEYQISFISYMRLRSAILNCSSFPSNKKKCKKPLSTS